MERDLAPAFSRVVSCAGALLPSMLAGPWASGMCRRMCGQKSKGSKYFIFEVPHPQTIQGINHQKLEILDLDPLGKEWTGQGHPQ